MALAALVGLLLIEVNLAVVGPAAVRVREALAAPNVEVVVHPLVSARTVTCHIVVTAAILGWFVVTSRFLSMPLSVTANFVILLAVLAFLAWRCEMALHPIIHPVF